MKLYRATNIVFTQSPSGDLTPLVIIMYSSNRTFGANIKVLDYWTQVALDAIWKSSVKECVKNDIETGRTDNWEHIEHSDTAETWEIVKYTPFTEPVWGIVVNR